MAKVTFACNELDENNWVFDFGGLKKLEQIYKSQFDHALVVASDDPGIELFKELAAIGIVQLKIMKDGVGIEQFSKWCFDAANRFVNDVTSGRVWAKNVTVYEHAKNFASYSQ
tara:strand:- start:1270 stop:1608 length:339 start_codon:yes stop_codon:yes gene_type:complete